jgi:hypothetical protein
MCSPHPPKDSDHKIFGHKYRFKKVSKYENWRKQENHIENLTNHMKMGFFVILPNYGKSVQILRFFTYPRKFCLDFAINAF